MNQLLLKVLKLLNLFTSSNSDKKINFLGNKWQCRGKKCYFIAPSIESTGVRFHPYCEADGNSDRNKL